MSPKSQAEIAVAEHVRSYVRVAWFAVAAAWALQFAAYISPRCRKMPSWDDLFWLKKSGNEKRKKDPRPRCTYCSGYGKKKDGLAFCRKTGVSGGDIWLHGWCHSQVMRAGGHEKCEHPECTDNNREKYGYPRGP
jgi:hypothetical protein